ncbi:MAG: CBS domain-containing protein [Firmicutes bacterium]|nr:CBS domain-containing protein [Bacillota bacterium]
MFVRDVCVRNVQCVTVTATAEEALALVEATGLHSIPVVQDQAIVGVITSEALYQHKLAGRSAEEPVGSIMGPAPDPVRFSSLVEEAAARMVGQPYNFLPVVEADGRFAAIVTRDALFAELCRLFGLGETNTRYTLLVIDRPGQIARLAEIVYEHHGNITHLITHRTDQPDRYIVVLRVSVASPGRLAHAFAMAGFGVLDAINFENGRRIGSALGLLADPDSAIED